MQRAVDDLKRRLDAAGASPHDQGRLVAIFVRPGCGERRRMDEARLDPVEGLAGDNWRSRGSRRTADGRANPDQQVTLMNARVLAAIAEDESRWELAGDQLIVDFDLDAVGLPAGTKLLIGEAVVAITAVPHTGCAKFAARFGEAALALVSAPEGRARNFRGVNARIVRGGAVRGGDRVRRFVDPCPGPDGAEPGASSRDADGGVPR
jgi:hypothetical protein